MAIQFARARYISRSTGGSAVRSAAYNARDVITAERTGEVFFFRHRDAPTHHAVLLPDGAAEGFQNASVLWNAAEAAERRRDAQVAREIVLALPADAAVSTEDRIELARSFAEQHFVAKGLAVQLDVHAPHDPAPGPQGEPESERANWHAHLLITTRRINGEEFSAKKARDLDPEVRRAGGRAVVGEAEAWGALWRDHQNRFFRAHGLDLQVDPTATHAAEHIGPVRMRRAGTDILQRAEAIRQANGDSARDPDQVLATLTRNNATFTERDLDRHLAKHIFAPAERDAVKAKVLEHQELVPLHDRETGEATERFTTRTVRRQERDALAEAGRLARAHRDPVPAWMAEAALVGRALRPDQQEAFEHAIGPGRLKLIEGRAGTGKSFTLAAIRAAHARDGRRVIGLAPTNAVAQDLKADGFFEAGTVHAALFALKNGRTSWDRHTVVIVDEAAMLDARVTGALLTEARKAGAKLILAGDDRQLASIERGGLFTELRQRHGAAEISEVTRQRSDWQRQAARDLAEGRFAAAVTAFDQAGAITWTQDQDGARAALVDAWKRDTAADPQATRFVFAYTNKDVDALNAELRQVRRDRGELAGPDVRFETKHGPAEFSPGDRVQFTETDKRLHIHNGNAGTITGINPATGRLTAMLDGGRAVSWSGEDFQGFRHGYAGTIYKGQGKTLDHTYLYHSAHWRSAASYVALTRQRESAQVFAARETARDASHLAWQMARSEVKSASVAWATRDEVQQAERARERQARQAEAQRPAPAQDPAQDKAADFWLRLAESSHPASPDRLKAKVQAALAARQQPAAQLPPVKEWLIPPIASRDGRDSLGRGLDQADITAAVAADARVKEAKGEPWRHLERAYRDPHAAHDKLETLIRAEGWHGAARQVEAKPEQLGRLLGRDGIFAGRFAQLDRAYAISAARSVASSLTRIAEAQQRGERDYRAEVAAQIARDTVGVPKLSAKAASVLEAVHAAASRDQPGEHWHQAGSRNRPAVAQAWEEGRRNPAIAAEIDRFEAAARQRLGEAGVAAAFQAAREGGLLSVPGLGPEHQSALHQIARGLVAAQRGRADHDAQRSIEASRQREQQQERLGQRRGLGLGR
jgi:Ti-type conjugative transfer relaxase TraA